MKNRLRTHLHPVAGAASILPRVLGQEAVRAEALANVHVVIETKPGFLDYIGDKLRPGQEFVIDGVQVDSTEPKGYRTDCKPGDETRLMLDEKGNVVPLASV